MTRFIRDFDENIFLALADFFLRFDGFDNEGGRFFPRVDPARNEEGFKVDPIASGFVKYPGKNDELEAARIVLDSNKGHFRSGGFSDHNPDLGDHAGYPDIFSQTFVGRNFKNLVGGFVGKRTNQVAQGFGRERKTE